ncbi:MAG: hypothetical protein FJ102_01700 [Deltaproteobacteria bacterium]|nr:hypothetical protein [Deltaproteobacteria bacterium]
MTVATRASAKPMPAMPTHCTVAERRMAWSSCTVEIVATAAASPSP